jgi:hypothetical protein
MPSAPAPPPAQPAPGEEMVEVAAGIPVYLEDGNGNVLAVFVGNADGTVTTTVGDGSSPTGWSSFTQAANGELIAAAAQPPTRPYNPIPPFYAAAGGAGGVALPQQVKIGGMIIEWRTDPVGGFDVYLTGWNRILGWHGFHFHPHGGCDIITADGTINPLPPPPRPQQ